MNCASDMRLLVVTTHYPFGTIEENWIAPEIEEFSKRFSRVFVLPVKELPGKRTLPNNVELLEPLASRHRLAFFLACCLLPSTFLHFTDALRELHRSQGVTLPRLALCLKFACYRAAFEYSPTLRRFLAGQGTRIVYAYWGHIPALSIPEARHAGARTCVRYHAGDLYVERPEVGGFYPWREEVHKASDMNAFISDHGLAYALKRSGEACLSAARVYRLGCRDFGPPTSASSDRVAASPMTIVSASWVHPVKRVELIAELSAELAQHGRVVWHHFGGGSSDAVSEAVTRAVSRGVDVHFHGIVSNLELQQFYRSNQVSFFVNLSRDEGVPVSIMEAMNAGIPIVATSVGGTPEVVVPGRSGILVRADRPGDLPDLAKRIIAALEDGGDLANARPREVWEERCNAERLAATFCDDLIAMAAEGAK